MYEVKIYSLAGKAEVKTIKEVFEIIEREQKLKNISIVVSADESENKEIARSGHIIKDSVDVQ